MGLELNRRTFLTLIGISSLTCAKGLSPFAMLDYKKCREYIDEQSKKDFVFNSNELINANNLFNKIRRAKSIVGYTQFNLLGFDGMLQIAKNYSKVGQFTKDESTLFEKLFYENATQYGFYGEKVITSLTDDIAKKDTIYIENTGHFLYRGKPHDMYKTITKDVGESIILTSGVRSIVKQMDLFLNKVIRSNGDLSVAAHSLAPAGYSFHGIGDFDVGKVGFGYKNFTSDFAQTDEYKKLIDSGYIQIRYPRDNPFGVRYEPWHIKVV